MIEEFAAAMFEVRDTAHREHLKTTSYAQHMALGSFYDSLPDKVDGIIEAYQGEFGLIKDFEVKTYKCKDIVKYLKEHKDWVTDNKKAIARNNAAVMNMLDDLVALFLSTIYKLENLS